MKKKRIIGLIAATLLMISTMFFAACGFSFQFDGCTTKKQSGTITVEPDILPASTFSLNIEEVEERQSYYYAMFEGEIHFAYYPEKITVRVNGTEREVVPSSVKTGNGYYTFKFERQGLLFTVNKGEHEVRVFGFKDGVKKAKPEKTTLYADDDYFVGIFCSAPNYWGDWDDLGGIVEDETTIEYYWFEAMDKESNWTPFY